ncbi:MAG: DUF3634 family protein [Polyangiaceae bacterium]
MQALIVMVVATIAALACLALAARRAITLCVIEVRNGSIQVTRGGIAPRLLADIGDVVARPRAMSATLRIVRSQGSAALSASGDLSDGQRQRIRNVIGSVPLAKLVNGRGRVR